jgi:SAM-dependent methyltransferase
MEDLRTDGAGLRLLPCNALLATSDVDHAEWNFRPILGSVIRMRYLMLQKILAHQHFSRVLEIGYGSGVYLPHLAQQADEVHGIDPHDHAEEVSSTLNRFGVHAELASASATAIPYPDQHFECVVAVSALEFIEDLAQASREINRVLKPGGTLAVVTPGESKMLDLGLKLFTGASPRDDFGDRRRQIIPTLLAHFDLRRRIDRPRFLHRVARLYSALELGKPRPHP